MAALARLTFRALVASELRTTCRLIPSTVTKFDHSRSRGICGQTQNWVVAEPRGKFTTHQLYFSRGYSRTPPANKAEIEQRVLKVCKAFDKITAENVTLESHFMNDLGLDSLDHVEIIMAMEDEFGFEIPDDLGEKLLTPQKLVEFIANHESVST